MNEYDVATNELELSQGDELRRNMRVIESLLEVLHLEELLDVKLVSDKVRNHITDFFVDEVAVETITLGIDARMTEIGKLPSNLDEKVASSRHILDSFKDRITASPVD